MSVRVDIQHAPDIAAQKKMRVPAPGDFRKWVRAALARRRKDAEVSLRIVAEAEIAQLNRRYRHKRGATNVLSFPADLLPGAPEPLLGDVVICAQVVVREAREQRKTARAHWAHMTVHGTLHLLGYDHLVESEADVMEAVETEIMARLGFRDPYKERRKI